MTIKRYDIHEDVYVDVHPEQKIMVEMPLGEYIEFKDVIELLEAIANEDTDMSPREAVIKHIIVQQTSMVEKPE